MNYETDIQPREGEGITDSDIADAISAERLADPTQYRPVMPSQVASWLAEDGTEARLRVWLDAAKPSPEQLPLLATDASVRAQFGLWSGVQGLLRLADLPTGRDFDLRPGTPARQLVDAAVAVDSIPATENDRQRLLERAMIQPLPTAESVEAARQAYLDTAPKRLAEAAKVLGQRVTAAGVLAAGSDSATEQTVRDAMIAELGS